MQTMAGRQGSKVQGSKVQHSGGFPLRLELRPRVARRRLAAGKSLAPVAICRLQIAGCAPRVSEFSHTEHTEITERTGLLIKKF
jgi:hypothetical protein